MKRFLCVFIPIIIVGVQAQCQDEQKTHASFMLGNYSYPKWEKIEFDTDNGNIIRYSFEKKPNGIILDLLGTKYVANRKVLMVKIPGLSKIYYIIQDKKNKRILMKSSDGTYNKGFPLGYEGPVNGIGTYCGSCANEPKEAFEIVDSFF